MNDKNKSEDEFVDENFEDEFEFGEEETSTAEPAAPLPFKSGDPRKFILLGIAIAVLGFIGYFGYQFFASPNKSEVTQAKRGQASSPPASRTQPPITKTGTPSKPAAPGKPEPTGFTEGEVAELLKPKEPVKEIPKETPAEKKPEEQKGTAPEPAKTAETEASEVLPQATVVLVPQSETTPLVETDSTPSPTAPTAAEMQDFAKQTQKTLEAFTKLNEQMENNLNQIKYLDSYTREVSLTVEKLNAQISAMDNRIQSLTNLANSLSKDLGKVRNEVGYVKRVIGDEGLDIPPAPTARKQRGVEYPYPTAIEDGIDCNGNAARKKVTRGVGEDLEYVVHAVIPGRAWLKSAKGQIITVTEGEIIGNYGKILVIDASNGVVLTSSGVTFR